MPWEGPHVGPGEQCEKKEVTETRCYGLTGTLIPYPPALLGVGEGGRLGNKDVKLSLGRRGQCRKGLGFTFICLVCFFIVLFSSSFRLLIILLHF